MLTVGELQAVLRLDDNQFKRGISSAESRTSSFGATAGRVFGGIARAAAVAGAAAAGVLAVGFFKVVKAGMSMNAELETSTLQFQTLMGSAEEAEAHVRGLFEFAAKTPFETGPIIEASRHLLIMGGAALSTDENLRRVGDAAAATSQPIEEVAFWVGRAYSMIQGGKPFGEAAMRLSEMGIISPKVRDEMEKLQASGAGAAEVWGILERRLDELTGAMALQAESWSGLMSTLRDVFAMESARITEPLFESLKVTAAGLIDFSNSPAWDAIVARARGVFERMGGFVAGLATAFGEGGAAGVMTMFGQKMDELATRSPLFDAIRIVFQNISDVFTALWPAIEPLLPLLATMGKLFGEVVKVVAPFLPQVVAIGTQLLGMLIPAISGLFAAMAPLIPVILQVVKAFMPLLPVIAKLIRELMPILIQLVRAVAPLIAALAPVVLMLVRALMPLIPPLTQIVVTLLKPLIPIIKALTPIIEILAKVIGFVLGHAIQIVAPFIALFAEGLRRIAGWVSDLIRTIGAMARAFASLKIPDWLTPGSPSPLEQTLWGIFEATRKLGRMPPVPIAATMGGAGAAGVAAAGGGGISAVFNITGGDPEANARAIHRQLLRLQDRQAGRLGIRA